jgi:hypothetical protein
VDDDGCEVDEAAVAAAVLGGLLSVVVSYRRSAWASAARMGVDSSESLVVRRKEDIGDWEWTLVPSEKRTLDCRRGAGGGCVPVDEDDCVLWLDAMAATQVGSPKLDGALVL